LQGRCKLKLKPVELCGLCGLAHFGISGTCPHLGSEVQIRLMLDALQKSNEPKAQVESVRQRLREELANRAMRRGR
jgi:hypothetical protein